MEKLEHIKQQQDPSHNQWDIGVIMNWEEDEYLDLLHTVMNTGENETQNEQVLVLVAHFMSWLNFDLEAGYPLLTTKKVNFKAIASELLWFLEGSDDERRLAEILYGKRP